MCNDSGVVCASLLMALMAGWVTDLPAETSTKIQEQPTHSYATAGGRLVVCHDPQDEGLYFDVPASEVAYNVQILRRKTEGYAIVYHAEPRKAAIKPGDSVRVATQPIPFRFTMPDEHPYVLFGDLEDRLSPLYSPMDRWNGTGNPMVVQGLPGDPFYYVFFLAVTEDEPGWKGVHCRHSLCQARTRDFRAFDLLADFEGRIEWKPFRPDSPAAWRRPWLLCDETGGGFPPTWRPIRGTPRA